ncbi:hypothetical protein [Variovorax sp. dw_954]|uniref:hypothetical protein n=1 Tax=Variovorax sp. dw_954 TaxID=2720078 RepID=UPI001BD3B21C|nr:hypothetical protein [Variovorax sp. dw_954]
MIEDEDSDAVGIRDPAKFFTALAIKLELLPPGETDLSDALWTYTMSVVDACATIGDAYGNAGGNAGAHIRAQFFDY